MKSRKVADCWLRKNNGNGFRPVVRNASCIREDNCLFSLKSTTVLTQNKKNFNNDIHIHSYPVLTSKDHSAGNSREISVHVQTHSTQPLFGNNPRSCITDTQICLPKGLATKSNKSFQFLTSSDQQIAEKIPHISVQNDTWSDPKVVEFCKKYKVMYIMRGLPGSGKSTLAQKISSSFHKNEVEICSADDFRFNKDGVYIFDASKLYETHKKCQSKAQQSCVAGKTVIIDNTNLTRNEFQVYLTMAKQHYYLVLFVHAFETNTDVLSSRNIHNVPKQKIDAMKLNFKKVTPLFYCWAFPKFETDRLKNYIKQNLALFASHCQSFSTFLQCSRINALNNLYDVFSMSHLPSSFLAHVTTFYAKNKQDLWKYALSENVHQKLGSVSKLNIIGYCITENVLFARVNLTEEQKNVFGENDACNRINEKVITFTKNISSDIVLPDFSHGCTAHVTLGVKKGILPVQSKHDLCIILDAELNSKPQIELKLKSGLLRCYKGGMWVVYLKSSLSLDAMFVSVL